MRILLFLKRFFFLFPLLVVSPLQSAIYDCVLFFNEYEILKVHLDELYDHVDYFVLVEATQTFSGQKKELNFQNHRHLFEKYLDKVIYVPVYDWIEGSNPWKRESFQRNQIVRGLQGCLPDDIVCICDTDEIIKPKHLPEIIRMLENPSHLVVGCDCDFYRWFLNRKDLTPCVAPVVTKFQQFQKYSAQNLRDLRDRCVFPKGAWHFSNMGGLSTYLEKIRCFSHFKEVDANATEKYPQHLYRSVQSFLLVEIDESYPRYIRENFSYYWDLNYIDRPGGSYF